MLHHRLTSLADLGAVRHRFSCASPPSGFIAFVTLDNSSGYLEEAISTGVLYLDADRARAWVFVSLAALWNAINLGLGINRRACRIDVMPVIRPIEEAL